MLAEPQPGTWQKLPLEKVQEHRRDMRGFAVLVHGANFSLEKELGPGGEGVNIRSGQHCDTAGRDKTADVTQKTNWTLHMFDDFNRRDKAKRCGAKLRGKIILVEIQRNMRHLGLETLCIAIDGDDVTAEQTQARCHGTGTRTKVSGADAGMRVMRKYSFANELMKSAGCVRVRDQAFSAA